MKAPDPCPVAYSYIRFSHPDQAKGDSLRRQADAARAWCQRNGIPLDESTTLHDLGKSAFTGEHRKNPDRHALAGFLELVKAGKVRRGSYLIIENLDRLSREHIQPALLLALNLLQDGVRIVQLKPAEMVFDDKSDTLPVMMMMMELSRGRSESAMKSERVGGAWAEKKERARKGVDQKATRRMGESCRLITRRLPAWVEEHGGRLELIPERAAVVRRIFALAIAGYGQPSIVKALTDAGVPGFGGRESYLGDDGRTRYRAAPGEVLGSGKWHRAAIHRMLADRRAVGEFQPHKRDGKKDGQPIAGYFPAVVTEEEWLAARAGAEQRTKTRGRIGRHRVNVFAGLLRNARDGDTYYLTSRTNLSGVTSPILMNLAQTEGTSRAYSFPFDVFEAALLSQLAEVNPREILDSGDGWPEQVKRLAEDLERAERSIASIEAELEARGDSPVLYRRLRAKEQARKELGAKLLEG